jgi:hypothetical protein
MRKLFLITFLGCLLFMGPVCYTTAAEKPATREEVLAIVDALMKDGKVQGNCIDVQPNRDKIVKVTLVQLTENKQDQFLVEGNAPCAFGARDPMWYVYEKSAGKYRLIADLGATGGVDVSKNMTNGWRDLICNYTYEVGTRLAANVFKFDGTVYKYSHTVEKGKTPGL